MEAGHVWTFLTNHAHVLVCLHRDPTVRLRDVAHSVGITERAVQRIVHDLSDAGYITIEKDGRRNHYRVNANKTLRHPVEDRTTVKELLGIVSRRKSK